VYGLLDDSWERYSTFCEAYEAAGKDLSTMTAQLQRQIMELLPSGAAVAAAAKLVALKADGERALEHRLRCAKATIVQQQKLVTDMAMLVKAAACKRYHAASDAEHIMICLYIKWYCQELGVSPSKELEEKLLELLAPTSRA
jgi:hypothetical protein